MKIPFQAVFSQRLAQICIGGRCARFDRETYSRPAELIGDRSDIVAETDKAAINGSISKEILAVGLIESPRHNAEAFGGGRMSIFRLFSLDLSEYSLDCGKPQIGSQWLDLVCGLTDFTWLNVNRNLTYFYT